LNYIISVASVITNFYIRVCMSGKVRHKSVRSCRSYNQRYISLPPAVL